MGCPRILVVEDERIVARDIRHRLELLGYAVCGEADSAEEAVAQARAQRPDLILMDIRLKGRTTGIEAAEQIREEMDTPIIYLTAHVDADTLQRAKRTGPFGFIVKPIENRELQISIEMSLYKHQLDRILVEQRQWLTATLRSIGEGVVASDDQGRVRFMNRRAEELTGWGEAEALGRPLEEVYSLCQPVEVAPPGQPADAPVTLRDRQGRLVPIEQVPTPIWTAGERHWGDVRVFRDISERLRAQRAQALVRQVSALFLAATSVDRVYTGLPGLLAGHLGFPSVVIDQYDPAGDCLVRCGGIGALVPAVEARVHPAEGSLAGQVARTGRGLAQSVTPGDQTVDPPVAGAAAVICEPLMLHNRVVGVLTLLDDQPHPDVESEAVSVQAVAGHLAQEFHRLSGEMDRAATLALLQCMAVPESVQGLAAGAAEFLAEWFGCQVAAIRLASLTGYPLVAAVGLPPDYLCEDTPPTGEVRREPDQVTGCVCDWVLAGHGTSPRPGLTPFGSFWSNRLSRLPAGHPGLPLVRFDCHTRHGEARFESMALIPLRSGQDTLGLLMLADTRVDRFAPDGVALLESLCTYLTLTLARKRVEEEMVRLTTAIEQAAENVIITDPQGRIQYVNPAFCRTSGWAAAEAIGQSCRILRSGQHSTPFYAVLWATIGCGETWRGRLVNHRRGGEVYEVEATITPVRGKNGLIANYVAVQRDVTEMAALEQRLRHAQKMEAIGTLAGGIAHDFNNILSAMLGFTELAIYDAESPGEVVRHLEEVHQAGRRAKDLVKQILAFSRQGEQEFRPIDVVPLTREALRLLRASLPATVELRSELKVKSAPIMGDPTQVHQVIMNLCTNAAHAMKDTGGTIEVRMAEIELAGEDHPRVSGLMAGRYVALIVADDGPGIPLGLQERIFDPFFTTKKPGEGTGMGLAMVHGIVKTFQGSIQVRSTPGQGAEFEVWLPLIVSSPQAEQPIGRIDLPRGGERVLFVDDEPALADLGRLMLGKLGYRVEVCAGSLEALAVFRERPEAFDLLITDQTMPQMTGLELAEAIRRMRGDLPVILCTGFSERVSMEQAIARGVQAYMLKPLLIKDMAKTVRRVLDGLPPEESPGG